MTWEDYVVSDVWVDCDPGIDDAVMLAALSGAVGRGRVRLHGLSSVAGNMSLDVTTANLLALASYLALPHVPVARGSNRPLVRAAMPPTCTGRTAWARSRSPRATELLPTILQCWQCTRPFACWRPRAA